MIHSLSEDNDKQYTNLIPTEMLYYYPNKEETMIINTKHPCYSIRKIFNGDQDWYSIYEQEELFKLKKMFNEHDTKISFLPTNWNNGDYLRFLYMNHFNLSEAFNDLIRHFKWLKNKLPIQMTDNIEFILRKGFIYLYGRDHRFRPMVFINGLIYSQYHHKFSSQDWRDSMLFFLEYILKEGMLPGQVESLNIIIDFKSIRLDPCKQLSVSLLELQDNYPYRFNAIYCINASDCDTLLLLFIKMITDDYLQSILKIYKEKNYKEFKETLMKIVNPRQLEMKYGGQNENMTGGYYPILNILLMNEPIILSWEKEEEILISNDEYVKKQMTIKVKENNQIKESSSIIFDVSSESTIESNKG